MVGLADRGVVTGPITAATSPSPASRLHPKYGARQSYSVLYDAVEAFFAEGGARVFISRFAGPAAVQGVRAAVPRRHEVHRDRQERRRVGQQPHRRVAGGVITVYENGTVVETSPVQADVTAAQAWSTGSRYIDITPVGSGALTDTAPVALTGGADDRTTRPTRSARPRWTGSQGSGPARSSCPATPARRRTRCSPRTRGQQPVRAARRPDTATASTITASRRAVRALGRDQARHCQLLAPWLTAPGHRRRHHAVDPAVGGAGRDDRPQSTPRPATRTAPSPARQRHQPLRDRREVDVQRHRPLDARRRRRHVIVAGDGVQTYDDVTLVDPTAPTRSGSAPRQPRGHGARHDLGAVAAAHMFAQNEGPSSSTRSTAT
jgi:hypothetical protein